MTTQSTFLKEMGISQWSSRDLPASSIEAAVSGQESSHDDPTSDQYTSTIAVNKSVGFWWFFGKKPEGHSEQLFMSMIRALGLRQTEWRWLSPTDNVSTQEMPQDMPMVAFAFGEQTAQKLSGERDSIHNLRETVLGFSVDGFEDLPLIASLDLNYLVSRPKEKSLLWQDLLLAKSVLQNI
jgi:uracil-DNA glycosylase